MPNRVKKLAKDDFCFCFCFCFFLIEVACENIRFSSLFAAVDVSRGGTSATRRKKFHTDDAIQYTVFTNGGNAGKNWCLVMKARRWRINKNCKWRLSVKLAECLARIPPKITLYRLLFRYNYVGSLLLLMFGIVCCLPSKGTRISSRKQDDFVGFRSIRSSTSGWWLEKSGKHVGPNFTLKPNAKAGSLQFCIGLD